MFVFFSGYARITKGPGQLVDRKPSHPLAYCYICFIATAVFEYWALCIHGEIFRGLAHLPISEHSCFLENVIVKY